MSARPGSKATIQDIVISSTTGYQKCRQQPDAARRALEMIEQRRQHQQFRGRADRVKPNSPRRVRPKRSKRREDKEGQRQGADRTPQRLQEGPDVKKRRHRDQQCGREDRDQRRRPWQRNGDQDGENINRGRPGRRIPPSSPQQRRHRLSCHRAHALPVRARLTRDVVLKPGKTSTSSTSPPLASTISWPTTCSRV